MDSTRRKQSYSKGYPIRKIIGYGIILAILSIIIGTIYINHQEEKETLKILKQFQQKYPEIEFPNEYDVKKDKEWDSGVTQYQLKGDQANYYVQIRNDEVIKLYKEKPEYQLYPVVTAKEVTQATALEEKIDQALNDINQFFNSLNEEKGGDKSSEKPIEKPVEEHSQAMSKTAYTIYVTKLLGETLIQVNDVQVLVESPEINEQTIQQATELLQDSVELYNEFVDIIPPEDWKALHESIRSMWYEYIVGETGLVNSMKETWDATADEREKAVEVMKEKGIVVGEYGLKLGDLMLEFLGELTGLSK